MVFSSLTDIILLRKHRKESCHFPQTNTLRFLKNKKEKKKKVFWWKMTYLVNIVQGNCSCGTPIEAYFRYCNYCILRMYEHCIFRVDANLLQSPLWTLKCNFNIFLKKTKKKKKQQHSNWISEVRLVTEGTICISWIRLSKTHASNLGSLCNTPKGSRYLHRERAIPLWHLTLWQLF